MLVSTAIASQFNYQWGKMGISLFFDTPSFQLLVFCLTIALVGQYVIILTRSGRWEEIQTQIDLWKLHIIWRLKDKNRRRSK